LNSYDLDEKIKRLQIAFHTTMRKIASEMSELKNFGLTGPQFFILYLLKERGKMTVTELAEELGVKPSAVTVMIERLHKSQFVTRERDENDRRVVVMELTDKGKDVLQQAIEKRKEVLKRYFSYLNSDEIETLTRIYEKLANAIQENE
jgi:MarR family transcriptional regulator, organic hydroperoxide resistance regulator